jgi:hypothetical protein
MSDNPYAYPGIDWPRIGQYLWITAIVLATVTIITGVLDFFAARSLAAQRPKRLRSAPVKRWREETRIWCARIAHRSASPIGRCLELVNILLSACMISLYLVSTYQTEPPSFQWSAFTFFCNSFFVVDWLLRAFVHQPGRRAAFALSPFSLSDIASIVGSMISATRTVDTFMTLAFVRGYCLHASWLNVAKWRARSHGCTKAQFIGVQVLVAVLTFSLFMSATIATIERASTVNDWGAAEVSETWHSINAIYFTFVTAATVGYGDIAPDSALGRLCVCLFIVCGAILFSVLGSALLEVAQESRAGEGTAKNATSSLLVLLTGSPDRRQICDVLDELFHPGDVFELY